MSKLISTSDSWSVGADINLTFNVLMPKLTAASNYIAEK